MYEQRLVTTRSLGTTRAVVALWQKLEHLIIANGFHKVIEGFLQVTFLGGGGTGAFPLSPFLLNLFLKLSHSLHHVPLLTIEIS